MNIPAQSLNVRISDIDCDTERINIEDDRDISELAASLEKHGQLASVLLRATPKKNGRYKVIFGGRRIEAAKRLRWESIDARVVETSDSNSLILFLCENLDRKELTDYEKGLVLKKIHDLTGKTYSEIAEEIGRSVTFVSLHVGMLNLFPSSIASPEERTKVLLKLSERHARALSRIEDTLERWNTAKLVVGAELGVRELERISSRYNKRSHAVSKRLPARSIAEVIGSVVAGLNSRDARPLFDSASAEHFTLFSRFPPFKMMNIDEAKDHVVDVLSKLDEFHYKITDMKTRIVGDFAYVILEVIHEIGFAGKEINTISRATVILQKIEGCWRIVHEHWSSANPNEPTLSLSKLGRKQGFESSIIQRMR